MSRRIYKSRTDRMISGVAGGLAQYLEVDPTIVRLAWVVLGFATGFGFLVYLAAMILVPEEPYLGAIKAEASAERAARGETPPVPPADDRTGAGSEMSDATREPTKATWDPGGRRTLGVVLLGLGAVLLAQNLFHILHLGRMLWPVALIAIGLGLLANVTGGGKK